MVLTRRQERLLKQQYRVADEEGESPSTPPPPKEIMLPDGRRLKSALKVHTGPRPWEDPVHRGESSDESPAAKRKVIFSNGNVVHVFQGSAVNESSSEEEGNDSEKFGIECSSNDGDNGFEETSGNSGMEENAYRLLSVVKTSFPAALSLILSGISSTWLVIYLKDCIKVKGLPFPIMLSSISQLGPALLIWLAHAMGLIQLRPVPSKSTILSTLLPIASMTAFCFSLGNSAFLGLSIAFISILKALVPAVTLIFSFIGGTERLTGATLCSTLLIAYGTGLATVQETSHSDHFDWVAFSCFIASIFFESARVVFVARLMGKMESPYSAFEVMAHVGPIVFVLMSFASIVVEGSGIAALGISGLVNSLPKLLMICVLSLLVNISSYLAIRWTSSTSFKVASCFKNAATLWLGTLQGDVVTTRELQGFIISTLGFLWYIISKAKASRLEKKKVQ